jgi:type II secretory pathway component PulF
MPTFAYQAADATGRDTSGTIDAPDRAAAIRQLTGRGLQPFKIAEGTGKAAAKIAGAAPAKAKGKAGEAAAEADTGPIRLKPIQVQQFTEEMAELLEAGMRLEPALKVLEGRGADAPHRRIAKRLGDLIREGHAFSSALRQSSPSFGELYCAVSAAGEAGGSLGAALRRQAQYLGSVREMRSQAAVALIYPGFLLVSAIGVVLLFTTFLIPRLSVLMANIKGGVPKGIQIIMGFSAFMRQYWWLVLAGMVLMGLAFWVWSQSKNGRPVWDRVKLRLPFLGNVLTASFHTQFLETLASLSTGGLPLLKGLELASRVSSNVFIQKQLEGVMLSVRDGAALSRALEKTHLFPARLLEMVRIGEHTGEIGAALRRTADRCGRDLGKALEKAMALMQPVIILVMAGLVGIMAYMMISVIFETIQSLNRR